MRAVWISLLAVALGIFLMSSAKKSNADDTTELTERKPNFLNIFTKKVEASQTMVTSFTSITTTSAYYVPSCTVLSVRTTSTQFCALLDDRRKRREAIFNGKQVFQEHDEGHNLELHSGLLEESRFLQTKNARFLKVFVKETWTSVQTVALPQVVYTTTYTPTTVTSIILRTTVFSTIYVSTEFAIGGIPEC